MLAQIECRDISSQVAAFREQLEIPSQIDHNGKYFPIYAPQVVVFENTHDLSQFAVELNRERLTDCPKQTVTFPTGGTWEEPYEIMASMPEISWLLRQRRISTIDEYWRLSKSDINYPMSYVCYTDARIGNPHGLGPENWIRPNGGAENPNEEAARFEEELLKETFAIKNIGIGPDPKMADGSVIPKEWNDKQITEMIRKRRVVEGSSHIGFVPKGVSPDSGAIYITLDQGTIFANKRYAPDPDHMPEGAITQGHGDFLRADLRIMVATGPFKQRNVEKVLFTAPSPDNPASMVTLGESIILLDIKAASRIMSRLGLF